MTLGFLWVGRCLLGLIGDDVCTLREDDDIEMIIAVDFEEDII